MLNTIRFAMLAALLPISTAACVESDSDALVESAFDEASPARAAEALSALVTDPSLRAALHQRLAERRTGDYEVLLSELADVKLADGRTLKDVLAPTGILESEAPFHVAAPLGLERWTDAAIPLVTSLATVPDAELDQLEYWRLGEHAGVRAADEIPSDMVLVIARNERMNRPAPPVADAVETYYDWKPVRVRSFIIRDDKEPWTKGDPEIYMTCALQDGTSFVLYLPGVNEENRTYWPLKTLLNWYRTYGERLACGVMEEDGGDYGTLSVSYSGVTYKLPIHDSDDSLGSVLINYNDPNYTRYYTGYSEFVLDWFAD